MHDIYDTSRGNGIEIIDNTSDVFIIMTHTPHVWSFIVYRHYQLLGDKIRPI